MVGTLLLLVALAADPSSANAKAETLIHRSILEYNGGDFDQALVDAKKAYALQPRPALLFNLGQVQRALHHWEEAAFSYKAYLRERPGAPNRAAVEDLIREMEKKLAEQNTPAAAPAPPMAVATPAAPPVAPIAQPVTALPEPTPPAPTTKRRLKVAVSELEAGLRADPKLSHLITGLITAELRRRPALAVTSQDDIKALLGFERQKALLGCTDASCLAEIGGALGVDQMLTGSLSRAGESLVLLVRLVDVHKGIALRDLTRRFPSASEDALLDAIPGVAAGLYPNLLPEVAPGAISTAAGAEAAPPRSSAPWWLLGTGAVVAALGGGATGYEFATRKSSSPAPGGLTTYPVTANTAQTANTVGYVGQSAIGVGAAVAVAGALWVLLRPAAPPEATP